MNSIIHFQPSLITFLHMNFHPCSEFLTAGALGAGP